MPRASVVREALDVVLARDREEDPVAERALRAAGCGASGVRDLGERHDDYLGELRRWSSSSTRRRFSSSGTKRRRDIPGSLP